MLFPRISIIGLGYIGLPTAVLLAAQKVYVHGIDVQQSVVDCVNAGQMHIVESGLQELLTEVVHAGYLQAHMTAAPADAFIITVPTPIDTRHHPDISSIKAAAKAIAPVLAKGNLIVLESTSPVGTTEQLEQWLMALRADLSFPSQCGEQADIHLAYCPERVLPGNIVHELIHNDRIIGGLTPTASQKAKALYEIFVQGTLHISHARTAELTKLAENAFRDVNIAFANELDLICHRLGIHTLEVINLANKHPRVHILQPGCGVGGHCIPVDPWFIVDATPEEAQLIHCARKINDNRPHWVIEQIKTKIFQFLTKNPTKCISDVTIACLGVSYKADTDDIRNSPALKIIQHMIDFGCQVQVVSPHVYNLPQILCSSSVSWQNLDTALETADVLCVLVKDTLFVNAQERIMQHEHSMDFVGLRNN